MTTLARKTHVTTLPRKTAGVHWALVGAGGRAGGRADGGCGRADGGGGGRQCKLQTKPHTMMWGITIIVNNSNRPVRVIVLVIVIVIVMIIGIVKVIAQRSDSIYSRMALAFQKGPSLSA